MHELSLMDNVLEIATRRARESHAARIHSITLRIGDMSGVAIEALTFAFDVLARDTLAADAELIIERVPARCRCPDCGAEFDTETPIAICTSCGAAQAILIQGREIELSSMEVS